MLPKEAIDEYKELYQKRFGAILSDEEALFRANNLLGLYRAVLGPESLEVGRVDKNNVYEQD